MAEKKTLLTPENGVLLGMVTAEDEQYLQCVADACERYNIILSEATPEERRFLFDRAEELLRDRVAVPQTL